MAEIARPGFSEVFDTYHGRVLAYARKLLGAEEAEDVAQEVFVKVSRSLETLDDPARLGPWLYAITLNAVRDAARKLSSEKAPRPRRAGPPAAGAVKEASVENVRDTTSRTPEESAIRNEMVICYLDYVGRLPPQYLEVYVLGEFEELSNEEIARRLGLSLATAKIRLHRARARLYEELRRHCRCYVNERGELMGEPRNEAAEPD